RARRSDPAGPRPGGLGAGRSRRATAAPRHAGRSSGIVRSVLAPPPTGRIRNHHRRTGLDQSRRLGRGRRGGRAGRRQRDAVVPLSTKLHSTAPVAERAVLVGVDVPKARIPARESVEELARLADTAGLQVVGLAVQPLRRIQPATYIGAGKVEEVKGLVASANGNVVVFDD